MITWASILVKALSLLSVVIGFAKDERLRGLGAKEAIASGLDAAITGIQIAQVAREKVRSDLASSDPERVFRDDGFRRD